MSVSYEQLDLCHRHFEEVDWSNPLSDDPLNDGLELWMKAGWAGGWQGTKWFDLSHKRHIGQLTNGPLWSAVSHPGGWGSIDLDGSNDAVLGSAFPTAFAAPLTISAWAYVRTSTATICGLKDSGGDDFWTITKDTSIGGWSVRFTANDRFAASGFSSSTVGGFNQWVHIVGVERASNDRQIYVNAMAGSASTTTVTPDSVTIPFIGTGGGIIGATINGLVDNFRVYNNRALSASEVSALYQESLAGHPTTLNWHRPRVYFDMGGEAPAGNRRRRLLICGAAA